MPSTQEINELIAKSKILSTEKKEQYLKFLEFMSEGQKLTFLKELKALIERENVWQSLTPQTRIQQKDNYSNSVKNIYSQATQLLRAKAESKSHSQDQSELQELDKQIANI